MGSPEVHDGRAHDHQLGLVFMGPGGDPGVADVDAVVVAEGGGHRADRLAYRPATGGATRGSGTSSQDGLTWAAATGGGRPGNGRFPYTETTGGLAEIAVGADGARILPEPQEPGQKTRYFAPCDPLLTRGRRLDEGPPAQGRRRTTC